MIYKSNIEQFSLKFKKAERLFNILSLSRLSLVLIIVVSLYFYTNNQELVYLLVFGLSIISFAAIIYFHDKVGRKKNLLGSLLKLNQNELDYLNRVSIPFENGIEFLPEHHPYSYDIDIVGQNSLFQHLNRCGTYPAKAKLAERLLNALDKEEILKNQEAIAELTPMIEFRQRLLAIANMKRDSKAHYDKILAWTGIKNPSFSIVLRVLSFLLPLCFWILLGIYSFGIYNIDVNVLSYVFLLNLVLLYSQFKKIRIQIFQADNVRNILSQYAAILSEIENTDFKTEKLKDLKHQLKSENFSAGKSLNKLASLFSSLEAIQNLLGAVIFNGLFLYHLHVLYDLLQWKNKNADKLKSWLDLIAEFETLNSFANFSYNNPGFTFPEINTEKQYRFESLGHPLLDPLKRVDNDVDFSLRPFIVLTGSNMSGKSTFLRAIAVNLVLGATGSVVCAKKASFHPMPLFVSMRLSDSLADSESYFYAEIKRLHEIMQYLENGAAFVLLDEILRGTNSEDKRNGTIGVLKKLIEYKAVGAIATHDLEVCNTIVEYPDYLSNQCFEVEIKNDNLFFDYKLKQGISQNKSASFLMKKMQIIS